jgi:hypothetical protein
MALREGAALAILTGKTDAMPSSQQRAEGQRLGGRPVDAGAGVDHLAAVVEEALDGRWTLEAFRHGGDLAGRSP